MSGVAVLLMIWHHFFRFSSWLLPGLGWDSVGGDMVNTWVYILADFGKICVQIFSFMSGYALFACPEAFASLRNRALRLMRFLAHYWIVYLLFIIFGLVMSYRLPSIREFLHAIFGINVFVSETVNVSFAWYVTFYCEFILLAPLFRLLFSAKGKARVIVDLAFFAMMVFLIKNISVPYNNLTINVLCDNMQNFIPAIAGMLCAKYSVFDRLHSKIVSKLPVAVMLALIPALVYINYAYCNDVIPTLTGDYLEKLIYGSIIVVCMILIVIELLRRAKNQHLERALLFVGSLSTMLWYMHGIFFTGGKFLQPQLYLLREPILIYLFGLAILIPICYMLNRLISPLTGKITIRSRALLR